MTPTIVISNGQLITQSTEGDKHGGIMNRPEFYFYQCLR
jgi:hypothetical protein